MAEITDVHKKQNQTTHCHREKEKSGSKRSPNWSVAEVQTLCDFVKEHKTKLFGLGQDGNKKGVNAAKKKHWELAAAVINAQSDANRHWNQVRKKWKDLSYFFKNSRKDANNTVTSETTAGDHEKESETVIQLSDINNLNFTDSNSSSSSEANYSPPSDVSVTSSTNAPHMSSVCDIVVKPEKDCMIMSEQVFNSSYRQPTVSNVLSEGSSSGSKSFHEKSTAALDPDTQYRPQCCRCVDRNIENPVVGRAVVGSHSLLGEGSAMSAYERSRLRIEEDKLELQRSALECLRDISYSVRRLETNYFQQKRRRNTGVYISSCKWRKRKRSHSESSERDY